jgi:hypothetical protein
LDELESTVIQIACTRLINLAVQLSDAHDFEGVAALFISDGAYARPSAPDQLLVGREAILAAYRARPPRITRHVNANVVITPESSSRARGASCLLLYTAADGQEGVPTADSKVLIGGFNDLFEKQDGTWLFRERRGYLSMRLS